MHPPIRIHGNHNFLFFRSLSKVENLSSRKKCHLPCLLHQNQNRIYPSQNCASGGSDITHLKISPTFVPFGHVMRCFLQHLSLLSILCTSKYIYYLILHFCYQKRCENTMFLQSAIVECVFLSRISNPICICMELLLDYPLWNYTVESQRD